MPVNTPSEVVDPVAAVTAAENEASYLDILVCGNCQGVFHFVEEFSEHKTKNDCEKADKSSLNLQQSNKKPQVWAFLLWKNSQQQAADQQGSWKLYQKWCNMPESQRMSWVTAGRNIQTFINLSHARELNKTEFPTKEMDQDVEDDIEEDFIVEKIVSKRYNHKRRQIEYLLKWEGYPPEQNTWEPLSNLTTCKSLLQEYEKTATQSDKNCNSKLTGVLKRDITPTQVKLHNSNLSKPTGIIPNRYSYAERKDSSTPTLQTQRKIVPVTPLSNSVTPNKISTPLLTSMRTEVTKSLEVDKSVNSIDAINDANKLNKSSPNSTPLKKRIITNSECLTSPIALSTEKQNVDRTKSDQSKEWCITLDDDTPVKRPSDSLDISSDAVKRIKLNETNEDIQKIDDTIDIPKSGIFKKSDLREKYPSINNIFGKAVSENADKSEDSKNENLRGLLRVDHSHYSDLVAGIYKMSLSAKGNSAKIELLSDEKELSAILLTMPGPRGGVIVLSNRFDLSKIVKPKPVNSEKTTVNTAKAESPAFRGIFPKNKVVDDSPGKVLKPDFHAKTANTFDNTKKPLNSSSLRKVLGSTIPRGKGRTSINSPTGISRFKSNCIKSYGDGLLDNSSSRLVSEGDDFLLEFCDYDNSDMENYSLPDDFPEELDMEPLSPTRPLTLDPETGKRLMRAEGEPTPQPTPEPSPEPSPVPSPVPTQIMCKEEHDGLTISDNLILKTDHNGEGETFAEINGNTYKVTNASQVGLLQNATYTQNGELKDMPVAGLTDEEVADNSNMLTITGDDGLVYQVANAKLEGDTIVVASGEDEQQCVYVTEDGHQVMQRTNEDGSTVLTLESAYADAVAQLVPNQVNILPDGSQIYVKQEENGQVELVQIQGSDMVEPEVGDQEEGQIAETTEENSGQVVAQLIEAGEPAPGGGPRRVVLLLPDGNIMVTEVDEEQFAALELEK